MTAANDTGALGLNARGSRAQLEATPDPQVMPGKVDRDWALVDALRRRESTAAERLLETFGDRVYRLALRRSEERRVGKECSSPCRSRWSPYH